MNIRHANVSRDERSRILFISPVPPGPDGIGVELRAWFHLETLAAIADVDAILAMTPAQLARPMDLDRPRALCRSLSVLKLDPNHEAPGRRVRGPRLLGRVLDLSKPAFRLAPDEAGNLRSVLSDSHFEIVFCFRIRSYEILESLGDLPNWRDSRLFVDFDDIESLSMRRELPFIKRTLGFERTLIARLDTLETSRLESRIARRADMISVCSEVDRQRLVEREGHARITVIPNSYPLMPALPLRPIGPAAKLLFLGTLSYPPNEDAVLFFCRQIYPRIRQIYAGRVRLTIVGRRPGSRVRALAEDPSIVVAGDVESVEPYYDEADLVVAPIRFGGGTRIKILEALSFGRAVVSTTLGAEGLDLTPGHDLRLADEPESFADACVELLQDQDARFRLATAGRARVAAGYGRSHIQRILAQQILDL
ncbi:glycosyltransferase family 4 protein [Nitrosovibrio sp. Nv17]|uniref:glycosyltransferase n=1 Tax=Nitrosovibrio sp. Nv17 TaxID=1855339 RepID=UPI000908C2F0|nr:glycosyltransferase family 4 protein [Nitrosovibrio sp. Nv17]SFW29835.1 Glycosyl transferases group 1 [Nitrosovibrio sp. Nv17]